MGAADRHVKHDWGVPSAGWAGSTHVCLCAAGGQSSACFRNNVISTKCMLLMTHEQQLSTPACSGPFLQLLCSPCAMHQ